VERQKYTREGLIHLCKTQPEAAADLILLLLERVDKFEVRVNELENALNKTSQNSHKPPSSDGYRRYIQTFVLPVMPVGTFISYSQAFGMAPSTPENKIE